MVCRSCLPWQQREAVGIGRANMPLAPFFSLTNFLCPETCLTPQCLWQLASGSVEAWDGAEAFWGQEVIWQDPQPTQLCRGSGMTPSFPYSNTAPATSPGTDFLFVRAVPFAQERSSNCFPTSGWKLLGLLERKGAGAKRNQYTYLLFRTTAHPNLSLQYCLLSQNSKTQTEQGLHLVHLLSQCLGHYKAGYLVCLKGKKHSCVFWTSHILFRLEGLWLVLEQTAGRNSKASLAIGTQGLAFSPPKLALQKQPFFSTMVEELQWGKAIASAEGCRGASGPQGHLSGGAIQRGCQDAEKGQCRQVQAPQWQPQQGMPHVTQSL